MKDNNAANVSKADWARVDTMTDEGSSATSKSQILVSIDSETLAWFEAQGQDSERHLSAALRIYAEAQKYVSVRSA